MRRRSDFGRGTGWRVVARRDWSRGRAIATSVNASELIGNTVARAVLECFDAAFRAGLCNRAHSGSHTSTALSPHSRGTAPPQKAPLGSHLMTSDESRARIAERYASPLTAREVLIGTTILERVVCLRTVPPGGGNP